MSYATPHTPLIKVSSNGRRVAVPLPFSVRHNAGRGPVEARLRYDHGDALLQFNNSPSNNNNNNDRQVEEADVHSPAASNILTVIPPNETVVDMTPADDAGLDHPEYCSLEILRHRFATFVHDTAREADTYNSATLFAEAILKKMSCRSNATQAMRIAAATWALEILAVVPGNNIIRAIRNELVPAMYIDYDASKLFRVTPSVQVIVPGSALQSQNPIFSHHMFLESRDRLVHETATLNRVTAFALEFQRSRKNGVFSMIRKNGHNILKTVLYAWRLHTRQRKVERVVRRNMSRRINGRQNWMLQQISFQSWRAFVERSRSTILAEKLHNTNFLLENAKNQFQIQCFRSDKHLHTVEELRIELEEARGQKEAIRAQVFALERQLREHEEASHTRMNEQSNVLLRELSNWRQFVRYTIESLSANTEVYCALETSSHPEALSPAPMTGETAADWGVYEVMKVEQDGLKLTDSAPDKLLLMWVQSILVVIAPHMKVRNFATDFKSGEVLLLVLHHVAPQEVSLAPLQETSTKSRLEKVVAFCNKVGLAHAPRVRDFSECNSDVMFVAVADLFNRYLQSLTSSQAQSLMSTVYEDEMLERETSQVVSNVIYDVSMLPVVLAEARAEMTMLSSAEKVLRKQQWFLVRAQESIMRESAYLTRERLEGNPVRVVGKAELEKYFKFKNSMFADLELKYKGEVLQWKEQLNNVRAVLQKNVHIISRLFKHYAGFATNMTESGFWRFCSCTSACLEKPLTKRLVERIFLAVNGVQVAPGTEDVVVDDAALAAGVEEVLPSEFIEILIRLADVRSAGATVTTAKPLPLSERLELLIAAVVKNHDRKLSGAENQFRREFYDVLVQKVCASYYKDISVVFRYVCQKFSGQARRTPLLDLDSMYLLLKDAAIIDEPQVDDGNGVMSGGNIVGITQAQAIQVIEENILDFTPGEKKELSLQEFIEILGALSVLKTPNPFVLLEKKVEVCLSYFVVKMKSKLRGHVAVSDVKLVTV